MQHSKVKFALILFDKEYLTMTGSPIGHTIDGKHPEAWLFANPNTGRAYSSKGLGELWNKYSQIPVTHYEATRHSFCTQLAEDGVNPYLLKDLARHSDIRTTQKYVHPTDERARQAVNFRGRSNNVVS